MSRPFIEFTQAPPLVLSCSEKREVRLKVKPRVAGTCEVTLRLVMPDCHFGNGLQKVSKLIQAAHADDVVECVFNLFARADAPGNYFTILVAQAQNSEGHLSFQRPIELEIRCTGEQLPIETMEVPAAPPLVSDEDVSENSESSNGEGDGVENGEEETADTHADDVDEDDEEGIEPEESPPQPTTPGSSPEDVVPLSEVVEETVTELEETADEVIDEIRVPAVADTAEVDKQQEPSGKSGPSGGCLGVWLLLAVALFWGSCQLENPELGVLTEEVITLAAENDLTDLPADGFSRLSLTAQLGPKADANEVITFFTEFGGFAEAGGEHVYEVTASSKTATATLVAGTTVVEGALLTATVGGFTAGYPLNFTRALPEDVIFTADKLTLSADGVDFTNLYVNLYRQQGQPSDGIKVSFSVEILSGSPEVLLVPFSFAENAVATVELRSANTEPGVVRITASTEGENGILERSLELTFE